MLRYRTAMAGVMTSLAGALALAAAAGCDGGVIVGLDVLPSECFTEDVVETGCFTETTFITVCDTVCEEDIFGFVECFDECFDEPVVEVICEDVVVDTFLVCN